jgi:tape measure domain-containing protein
MSAILPQLLPLLIPIIGLKGLNLGDTIVKILNNNLAIKPGFLNDLFKSLTGIKLEKTGFISAVTNTLGISKGSQSPITSPVEVINKQISQNLGSVGTGGSVSKLVENTGQMLVSAVLKQFGVSGAVGVAIEAMVKGRIANIANLGIFTNTGGKGIGGRVRGIAESYSQGDVDGVIGKSSKLAGTILRTIGFKVDMKQLTLVMGTAIAGITAFHKAFAEEGLGLGQALIKGFKEAQKNWGNAFDDMKTNAKKAMGMDVLGDLAGNIVKKVKQGTVVSREAFSELFDELGKTFKNKALGGDKQGIFGNILGFGASISTMIAPITTMAASLLPLLIPLMPVLGAIGGIAVMVGGKIAGLANAIKEVEPLQRRLNFLGGSPAGGDREMKYAQGVANKLNVPVKEGIQAYSQLAIAARGTKLEGDGVRELYEGISASLGALGISGQDASLVFMAYTQILAKGKLSMEELRQQLGEKFPPTMGVFAKSLGVSVGELNQLVGKGAILSEDILPKVAKTLNEDYGKAAANSAGSFTVALTKLGNVGFDIAIKLTKAFGGTFAMFANVGANALGMFRDTLDQLLPLFNSLMIGVTAVVGVGLATILSASPIAKFLATVQNLITAGLGALMVNLAPFYIGIIADVADGWLGAQNDLMDNMMRGVGNMAVAMATALDNLNRTFTGKSLFSDIVGKKEAGNPFQGIIDGFGSLFKLIPPGVVELGALVLMFEQVQVLFKMFLWPTILGGWKSFSNVLVNFANMAKPIGTILSELLVNTTGLMRGMGSGKLKFGETFGNAWKSGLAAIGTGLKALTPLAIEAALALGVLLFAKSDFTNPISDSIGKMATGINSAIKSINGSLDDLANKFDNAGKSARDMANNLPSKGMELNVQYALGLGGKSFKSDDFINQANASEGFGGNIQRSLIRSFSGGLNNLNPIYNAKSLASILGYQETPESVKQNKIDADKYGIGKYFTGKETTTNLAQTQLLNQVKDIQLNKDGLNKFFSDTGLTAGTDFSKNVKQAANQVRELDKQLFSLGQKRSKLGSLNTSASKVQIAELDKQLMVLEKQRGVAAKEIVNIDAQVKEVGAFDPKTGELASGWLKDTMDAIRDNKEMPLDVRMKLIADLKPMEDAIRTASQKIAKLPVDPLKEIYQTTISALRDFEVVYDKFLSTNKIGVANRQEALYSSGTNQGNLNQGLSFIGLQEQEQQKDALSKLSAIRKRSFDNLNSITNFGKTDEQKKELDDLRKAIKDDNENLAKMGADIAKSRRDIRQTLVDQTKQVADYYRTAVREAQAVSIEFQKAQKTLENSRMQNKLREALIGAGDNIYTQFIEGIINIISQTADIEKQQLEAKKQRIDYENNVQDIRLQAAELQRSLPGKIIPLDSSMADNFNLSLEEINGTVGTINGSVKDVANSLSNDVVEAAKKANAELDKLNGTFKNLQSVTDNWIDGFGNKITDVLGKLNLTVGVTANVVTNTPAWAANASSILQGLPINTSSATSPINTGKTIFDPQTINEGVKAAAKFNTQANMCAASVKAFTDKVGINTKAMDLTADSSKRVGTVMTDFSKIKPGDLIGWSGTSRFGDEHIGVYIDGQKIFHQSGSTGKKPGVYNDFDYFKKQKGAYFVRPFESVFNTTNAAAQKQQRQPVPKVPPVPLQTAQVGKQQSGGVLWGKAANYAPSNLSGLTARGKKAMAALQNPNVRAFLDAVAVAEVGEKVAAQGGYGYLIGDDIKGRESFDPNQLGSHPGRRVRYGKGKNQVSSATGRYQTMDFVAKEEFGRLGLKDFKPQSQEILAVSRLMYRGVLEDIKKGNFSSVITRKGNMDASSEWASLQGNPYGQGSPTGKTSVFVSNIQRNLQMLNAASAQGKFIDPNSMQQAVNQAGRLKLNTAAQQLQTNQINSNLSPEQIKENELKQRLEAYRFIRSTRKSALGDISSTKDSTLGTQRTVLEGLSPNMSNADRFGIQLADLRRKIEKDIEALQQIIDDTDGAIAQKPDLQAAFNLAMKRFPNDPKLAADAIQTNDLTFKATAFRNAEAKNNLAFLKSNVDDILKASIADFDKKEFFRLSEQDIAQQTKVIEQLQQQLQSIQKLEEIDPLNPLVLKIPSLQKNIDLLSLNRDQYQQLLDLQKRYYEGGGKGGNMSEEAFQKEFKAILSVNSIKKEGIDLNFNYANTVKKIEQATKELAKAELIQASQMKSLQLDNERFAIDNRNGLVSIIGLTNELTMKTNELTNAYKRQLLEIEGNNLLNKPGDKLRETLKADRAFQMGLSNIQTEFAFKGKEAELVTNPQVELDTSSKMFDLLNQNKFDLRSSNIETLKSGMANEFYTNRLTRDLETEKEVERARRAKEQLKIDIEKNKLENIGSPEKIFNADQIREMSAALDELNKKKLDDITKSAQTFDMALKKVFQENLINGLTSGFTELINGTKSFGDVLNDLANNILNGVLNIALNSLLKSAFGGGGLFGGIFGFNKGGIVPNFADGGVIGAIGDALQRERQASGVKPVLAALTPGERVLTVRQNKRFEELQMERVLNYVGGGVVGSPSTPNMNFSAPAQSSTVNVSVPVNINGGQGDTSVNVPQLQNAVRSAVLAEIQKQQRPGGALGR